MRKCMLACVPVFVLVLMLSAASAMAAGEEATRVGAAADVMNQIMEIPEKSIPPAMLAEAQGLVIVPGVVKVGLVVGGQYGRGVLVVREKDGSWSEPVFVTLTSGSVGWQIGAESTDFILVFKNRKGIDGILKGKYTLGADVAVAAGPVGRRAEAATDVKLAAEIYSYSRNRGLFAGVSLEGSSLQVDDAADAAFYGRKGIHASEIVAGKGMTSPAAAEKLQKALARHTRPAQNG
ncbi:MAG: lipid-binding SYLF domain-containing protein [Deltaproteobacteria bacterium]|nr:lipid-binding SYLF domain-containing protein [Candidatus Deferrimicrobiaceae bacterium]